MKKIIFAMVLSLYAMSIHAQLTLEHTFSIDNNYSIFELVGDFWNIVKTDDAVISIINSDDNTVSYYNPNDFSLVELLNINPPQGYHISSISKIPTGLYKNDNNEYYFTFSSTSGTGVNRNRIDIFMKSGNTLNLEASVSSAWSFRGILCNGTGISSTTILSNGTKRYLFISSIEPNILTEEIKVYSFPGSYNATNEVKIGNSDMKPYPNPSKDKIHLTFGLTKVPSSIRIYDTNGKMIDIIKTEDNINEYILDVSSYSKGIYFYEIDGNTQSFIIE